MLSVWPCSCLWRGWGISHEWSQAGPTREGLAVTPRWSRLFGQTHAHQQPARGHFAALLLLLLTQTSKTWQNLLVLLGRWPYMALSVCPYVMAPLVLSLMFFKLHWDVGTTCSTTHRPGDWGGPAGHCSLLTAYWASCVTHNSIKCSLILLS